MKVILLLIFFVAFTFGLPVANPVTTGIVGSGLFSPRPVGGRPVIDRPVEPRPIESRPIRSHPIKARQIVPNAYIVEFKEGYTHDAFRSYLKEQNVVYEFQYVYDHPKIFYGVSIQLQKSEDYDKVKSWKGVKRITPVQIVTIPEPPVQTEPVSVSVGAGR